MSEEAIGVICDHAANIASPETAIGMMALGREIARQPADATPYQHRDAEWFVVIQARWREANEDESHIGWARGLFDGLAPHATGTEDYYQKPVRKGVLNIGIYINHTSFSGSGLPGFGYTTNPNRGACYHYTFPCGLPAPRYDQ